MAAHSFLQQLEDFGDEIIQAVISDLSRPEAAAYIKELLANRLSVVLGLNINNAFIRPKFDALVDEHLSTLMEYAGLVVSDPPYTVDASADIVKEEVVSHVDSFAERLKARLDKKAEGK